MIGQPIVQHERLDLLLVKCPECGAYASVREHFPSFRSWAGRVSVMFAVAWFVALLLTVPVAIEGFAQIAREVGRWASEPYARRLETMYGESFEAGNAPMGYDFAGWYQRQDPDALLASAGGFSGQVPSDGWGALGLSFVGGIAAGWFWSVALLPVWRWLIVVGGLVLLGVTGTGLSIVNHFDGWDPINEVEWRAFDAVGMPMAWISLLVSAIGLVVGVGWGRGVTRHLALRLLPKWTRPLVSGLWTGDGLVTPWVERVDDRSNVDTIARPH